MKPSARLFQCAHCHAQVIICSYCDHGQRYCSPDCAQVARKKHTRIANERYQKTRSGRHYHAERQQRYRDCKKNKIKIVTYQGSLTPRDNALLPNTPSNVAMTVYCRPPGHLHCHVCKKWVSEYLRIDVIHSSRKIFSG